MYANCLGYYRINDIKKRFGEPVVCGPGKQEFEIYAGMPAGVPSVRIEGETITSDGDGLQMICQQSGTCRV